jgi:transposase InsO family protein
MTVMKKDQRKGLFGKALVRWQDVCRMANLTVAQSVLNPTRKYLSLEARKRVGWIYDIEYCHGGNVSRAARKIGVSREWLTKLYGGFRKSGRDVLSLEPRSRAPLDVSKRNRSPKSVVTLILTTRRKYPAWGKEKIVRILLRDHKVKTSASTVGRILKKSGLVHWKLSDKNKRSWRRKKNTLSRGLLRERPPHGLADAAPGSLVAKDMKLVPKLGKAGIPDGPGKDRCGNLFWYQHTMVDSCSRFRVLSFVASSDAATARDAFTKSVKRFPFSPATLLNDNGSENAGVFQANMRGKDIVQFWSRPGTPTDNPRVERSHRSDDDEFYALDGNMRRSLPRLVEAGLSWEKTWNEVRPHQALNNLTPLEFCKLWKTDQVAAEKILLKWNVYLAAQSKKMRTSRKEKKEEKIRAINAHLKAKLGPGFTHLKV